MNIQPTRQVRRSVSHRWDKDLNKALARKREAEEEEDLYKQWDRRSDLYSLVRQLISVRTKRSEKTLTERYEEARNNVKRFKALWGEFTYNEKLHIRVCAFFENPERPLMSW